MLRYILLCVLALTLSVGAVNRIPTHAVDEVDGSVTNLLSTILDTLATNATTASNDIALLTAAIETNAFMDDFNSNVGNINFSLTSNIIYNLLGTNVAYQQFTTNAYAVTTNITSGISNIYTTIDDGDAGVMVFVDLLSNNFETINANFNYVSNDFNTLQGYLITNSDAVIPLINSNMYITITNFTWVNENYVSWSNGIYAMALALSQSIYGFTGTPTVTLPYTLMDTTNYTALSTNLVFTFPQNMSNTISDLSSGVASGLFYAVTTSNTGWLALLQSANDTLNDNFTAVSNAYTNTQAVVNDNAALQQTNMYKFNFDQVLLSNRVYQMAQYIVNTFTNIGVPPSSISNAMGWDYPYVLQTGSPSYIEGDLGLGYVDLTGAFNTLASNQVVVQYPAITSYTVTNIFASGEASGFAGYLTEYIALTNRIGAINTEPGPDFGSDFFQYNQLVVPEGAGFYVFNCWYATATGFGSGFRQPLKLWDSSTNLIAYKTKPNSVVDAGDFTFGAVVPDDGVINFGIRFVNDADPNTNAGSYFTLSTTYQKTTITE